jgi:dihydroorotate dehydrogenase
VFDYFRIAGPLVRLFPAETAHGLTIAALKTGLVPHQPAYNDPVLSIRLWGRDFKNPVGLAAGFDKNAEVPDMMLGQGFGFVEIGSVTPRPQPGNPRPRLFRLSPDKAVINRMGFNNEGMDVVAGRLARRRRAGIVGANLGKNKDTEDAAADYEKGVRTLGPLSDYLVINVSSPNTPGLRALQGKAPLEELVRRTRKAVDALAVRIPLLLKIAPDLTEEDLQDIAEVALAGGLDGLIVSNTTITRPDSLISERRAETGGLSGTPLFAPSTEVLRRVYTLTQGRLPLIGVGGIASGADAYAKIRAGASLLQVYSALVYQGTSLVTRIKQELAEALRRDGFTCLLDAVGVDAGRAAE